MSTADTANPAGTLMIAVMFGCLGVIAVQIGIPTMWVMNAMVALMTSTILFLMIRFAWGQR